MTLKQIIKEEVRRVLREQATQKDFTHYQEFLDDVEDVIDKNPSIGDSDRILRLMQIAGFPMSPSDDEDEVMQRLNTIFKKENVPIEMTELEKDYYDEYDSRGKYKILPSA